MPPEATVSIALLGPTNTGKTHQAVERMLEHESGMIGLPLRLLAREVYDRVSTRVGRDRVALVTGEEKRVPRRPDYWVCTTEAMPIGLDVDFIAVDEVQLAAHDERGHVFTERLLHARGRRETWFMGSASMRPLLERLVPAAQHKEHPRFSRLTFAGSAKLQKLPPRSAVVAFSVPELYELAHRLRVLRGGAAVVLGALSPRARNAQVAMFQAGEVEYLVATDAVGMGLNLDVGHVAFASLRKFDGRSARQLNDSELAQIAGRAGRYLRDGTFGTVSPCELPLESARHIEQHRFDVVRRARYRNADLDFSSANALLGSLERPPPAPYFAAVPDAVDLAALKGLLKDPRIAREASGKERVELLWGVCQVPDFRHILFEVHLELLRDLFSALEQGPLKNDFLTSRTQEFAREEGNVDALLARIARLRTWAFVVNHAGWCEEPALWSARLNELEDQLSDALHRGLVSTFVERRGKARPIAKKHEHARPQAVEEAPLDRHHPFAALSRLRGQVREREGAPEAPVPSQLSDLVDAPHSAFTLDDSGKIFGQGMLLGKLVRGANVLAPNVQLAASSDVGAGVQSRLERRLLAFARDSVSRLFEPIVPLRRAEQGGLRAIAYQLEHGLGSASARELGPSIVALDAGVRARLQGLGVKLGLVTVYLPALLRAPALELRALLLKTHDRELRLPPLGRAHYEARNVAPSIWLAVGYVVLGMRACRVDLVERAAAGLAAGANELDALRGLSLPKREVGAVARALKRAISAPRAPSPLTDEGRLGETGE